MLYDLVNMSDKITFVAPNRKLATLVTLLLGRGQYSANAYDDAGKRVESEDVPFFMFGGFEEFWAALDAGPAEGAADRHAADLVPVLESVTLGDPTDRRLYDSALKAIDDPAKRSAFIDEWNDQRRSSMNDIMGRAHKIAKSMRGAAMPAREMVAPQQVFPS